VTFFPASHTPQRKAEEVSKNTLTKEERTTTRYDLVILGNGAAAFAAAIKADELKKKAALVQGGIIGGTCVNVGCVPSKRLLVAGEVIKNSFEHNLGNGTINPHIEKFSFQNLVKSKNQMVTVLRQEKYEDVLKGLAENVHVYKGKGIFVSKDQVKITNEHHHNSPTTTITGDTFLIATGSSPRRPGFEGIEDVNYWTNVEALSPPFQPKSMIVIGGRALGLEFAQMYARLGTKVTLLQRSDAIIPEDEPEIAEALSTYLKEEGVDIRTGVNVKRVSQSNSKSRKVNDKKNIITVEAEIDGKKKAAATFKAEALLLATGRAPNSKDIGVEELGIKTKDGGAIVIDNEMRTNIPNIFAAGDVTGEPMLEALAARQGTKAAENALMGLRKKIDLNTVPRAIFTDPQLATVGLTEREVLDGGYECNCRVLNFSDVSKARIIGNTRGVIKMVVDNETYRILGIHILCPNAADLITEAALIIKHNYTAQDVVDTIHVFPTLSEAIKIVAQSFFRDVGATSCCI
jgi:mercuric reductase